MQPRRKLARLTLTLQGKRSHKLAATQSCVCANCAAAAAACYSANRTFAGSVGQQSAMSGAKGSPSGWRWLLEAAAAHRPGKRNLPRSPAQPRQRTREYAAAAARAAAHLTLLQFAASEPATWRSGRASRCRSGMSRAAHDLRQTLRSRLPPRNPANFCAGIAVKYLIRRLLAWPPLPGETSGAHLHSTACVLVFAAFST